MGMRGRGRKAPNDMVCLTKTGGSRNLKVNEPHHVSKEIG